MISIGIDVSTRDVAIAVIKNNCLIATHKFFNPKVTMIGADICNGLLDHANGITELPTVYIERAHYQQAVLAKQVQLGYYEIIGCIIGYLGNAKTINPNQWKKAVGYPNNAGMTPKQKAQLTIDFVREKWGIVVTDNDIADAICIAKGGEIIYGEA